MRVGAFVPCSCEKALKGEESPMGTRKKEMRGVLLLIIFQSSPAFPNKNPPDTRLIFLYFHFVPVGVYSALQWSFQRITQYYNNETTKNTVGDLSLHHVLDAVRKTAPAVHTAPRWETPVREHYTATTLQQNSYYWHHCLPPSPKPLCPPSRTVCDRCIVNK